MEELTKKRYDIRAEQEPSSIDKLKDRLEAIKTEQNEEVIVPTERQTKKVSVGVSLAPGQKQISKE